MLRESPFETVASLDPHYIFDTERGVTVEIASIDNVLDHCPSVTYRDHESRQVLSVLQ